MSRITAPRGSFGYAQDRLFDSAPSAVPRDKSVRRFAQDDDFVGGLKKNSKLVNACGTQSWVEIRETKSPAGTTGNYQEISKYSAIENSPSAALIHDHFSIPFQSS